MKMTEKQQRLANFLKQSTIEGGVDFHLHSSFSDGLMTPSEVLRAVWEQQLRAAAITDHDTLAGISEALAEQATLKKNSDKPEAAVNFIPGIELSTYFADTEIHLLAYFPEKPPAKMYDFIAEMQKERRLRNQRMFSKVQEIGYDMSIAGPEEGEKAGEVWGRAHLARQLVKDGHFRSSKEAFRKLLSPGKPAYIARRHFTAPECLDTINAANGVAVLAHPQEYKFCPLSLDDEEGIQLLSRIFRDLKTLGLHGIEAFHGMVNPDQAYLFYKLAQELDLIVTQGSDNHGPEDDGSHHAMFSRETNFYRDYVLLRDKTQE